MLHVKYDQSLANIEYIFKRQTTSNNHRDRKRAPIHNLSLRTRRWQTRQPDTCSFRRTRRSQLTKYQKMRS